MKNLEKIVWFIHIFMCMLNKEEKQQNRKQKLRKNKNKINSLPCNQ
jgi:hypothetical protein